MDEKLGARGGKKDRKLFFLNKRRKKIENEKISDLKLQEEKENQKKKEEEILIASEIEKETISLEQPPVKEFVQIEKPEQDNNQNNTFNTEEHHERKHNIDISNPSEETQLFPFTENQKNDETNFIEHTNKTNKAKKNDSEKITSSTPSPTKIEKVDSNKQENIPDYIEKQVIKILEQDIEEKKYQLKKVDSEIHTIQKSIDSTTDEKELAEIEIKIQKLIDMVEQIKRQIYSLEKTFDFKFPVEEPDNYLIYLVDEYKEHYRIEKDFNKKLYDNKEYKSLINTVIEIEDKQEEILEQMQNKKEQLGLEEEQVEKLNNDVIDIEKINQDIKKMIEKNEKVIEEIESKVNETVHITEKIKFITKTVDHTMLDLFLLMSVLKHNLSIKNNAIAAATAALALDMIIKMTTPIQERVTVKDNDFKDYEKMINSCMNDTGVLEQMIGSNLNKISSIRYTFEKDYGSCSYLPSYQDALKKLTNLEDDMKDRKKDIARMKKDMELQLEKNNAKVKKYGSMNAA